jgi:hypothetical protein
VLDNAADRRGHQQECPHALALRVDRVIKIVADDRGDDAGGAIGRRGDDASSGGVLLVDRHGVDAEPVHDAVRLQAVCAVLGEQLLMDVAGAALHLQTAGKDSRQSQPALHAGFHRRPDTV